VHVVTCIFAPEMMNACLHPVKASDWHEILGEKRKGIRNQFKVGEE
jgi:hypothetical protein